MKTRLVKKLYRLARDIRRSGVQEDSLRDPAENYRMAMDGYILSFYSQTTR